MEALVDFVLNARPVSYPRFHIRSTTEAIAVNLPRAIEGSAGRYGDGLGRFAGVSQLGGIPYVSKVMAFVCPESPLVYRR